MKNKNAKNNYAVVWVVVIIAVVGALFYFGVPQSVNPSFGTESCGSGNLPYIDAQTVNQYSQGTGVTVTYRYIIDGSGDPSSILTNGSNGDNFEIGDKLKIHSSATGFIDQVDEFTITQCGANRFRNKIKATDGGTIDILDQNYNAVTDGVTATAVNLSDGGSANPLNAILRIDGVVDETTGQLYITVETNDTEVDKVTITAKSSTAKVIDDDAPILDLFVAEGTAPSLKTAFIVDEVLDGGQADYNLKFTPESGVTMGAAPTSGFVYVNAYEGQWFVDTDGTYQFGWEDADGTAKHEGAFTDHDALIS